MSRSRASPRPLVLVAALAAVLVACQGRPNVAHELEERLLAPCCWRESLRHHESDTATRLRAEIEARIAAGEAGAAIEADLVRRHGDRIRALPAGADPRWMIGVAIAMAALVGLAWIVMVGRRRAPAERPSPGDPVSDDRLDDELAAID